MRLSELSDALADMRDYWIVRDNIYSSRSSGFRYRADKDRRFRKYLKLPRRNGKAFRNIFFMEALSLVSSLSSEYMDLASREEVSEMTALMGYDPRELNRRFVPCEDMELLTGGLISEKLAPSVLLLAVAAGEALYESSGSVKNRESLPSMKKLRQLVLYMQEKDILYIDYKNEGEYSEQGYEIHAYEEFMIHQSEFLLEHICLGKEAEEIGEENEEKMRRWEVSYKQGIRQAAQSAPNLLLEQEKRERYRSKEEYDFSKRSFQEREELLKSFETSMQQLDEAESKIKSREREEMSRCNLPAVAAGALISIMEGDEVFLSEIGQDIFQNFIDSSAIPSPRLYPGNLDDEEEWENSWDLSARRKLTLKIYDENDFVTLNGDVPSEEGEEEDDSDSFSESIPVSAALARYSGHAVASSLFLRKSYISIFRASGYSERRARDFAVILATLERIVSMNDFGLSAEKLKYFPEEPEVSERTQAADRETAAEGTLSPKGETSDSAASGAETPDPDSEIEAILRSGKEAEKSLKRAARENQEYRHEIASLQREIEKLKEELSDLRNSPGHTEIPPNGTEQNDAPDASVQQEITFPYKTDLKVVVYGGFDVFHQELLKYLPDLRILPPASHLDLTPLKTADIVFLQTNKTNHAGYYMARDTCKNAGIPCFYLNYASAERCAEEIVRQIQKLTAGKAEMPGRSPD